MTQDILKDPFGSRFRQIDVCEECGYEVPRSELAYRIRAYGTGTGGSNILLYGEYDDSFWTCDASDEGQISMGPWGDRYRVIQTDDGTGTWQNQEAYGSQTWSGSGTMRSTVPVDISSYTNIYMSGMFGCYHAQSNQDLTGVLGFCNSDGSVKWPQSTWSVKGMQECWFTLPLADLESGPDASALYVYYDVTISGATDKWFVDWAVLNDNTEPQQYQPLSRGAAVSKLANQEEWHVLKMCRECGEEKNVKPSEREGDPRWSYYVEIRNSVESL